MQLITGYNRYDNHVPTNIDPNLTDDDYHSMVIFIQTAVVTYTEMVI